MGSLLHSCSAVRRTKTTTANRSSVSNGKANSLARSLKVREASFEDHAQIAALQSRYGLESKSFEEWQHLWSANPAYREYQGDLPIGWVLESGDKSLAGYLGNIPLFYEFQGHRFLASVAHSWVVNSQYRSYALLLLEEYFSQEIVELFLNATVGPAASDSFAVFQSSPVPAGAWDQSAFWITNYQRFLAGWLVMKGFPLAKPLSYVLSLGPLVKNTLLKRTLSPASAGVALQACTEIDNRFDVFWDALRKRNPHVLRAVRSREILEWHFKYALRSNRAWIVTAGTSSCITAYAIFCRYDNPRLGLKRMRLTDFQTLDGNTTLLECMLCWALGKCRSEGIHMLESIGFRAEKQDIISKAAPYERKLPSWLYFYKTRDRDLAEKLTDPNVWDPSQFDGDASL